MNFDCQTPRAAATPPRPSRGWWLGWLLMIGLTAEAGQPTATNLWTFSFSPYGSSSTPAVSPEGTIYAGEFNGRLYAIAPDGKERWHFRTGDEIKSSPAIGDDGTIYFGSRDHRLYALTPAGKLKWKFATGAWVDSSPAIAADGTIYFGSWDRQFYALNPDGTVKWKFFAGGIVNSSPAIAADGTIYFGSHDKKFYALDAGGKPRWTFLTGAEITASPALSADGSVFFSSTDGNLYRLKADGTERWHCRIGGGSDGSPVLEENGNVVMAAGHKTLIISPAGAILWSWESGAMIDETPLVFQDAICFSAPWFQLWARHLDGTQDWELQLRDMLSSSPMPGSNGEIYFCCFQGLQAVQPPAALHPAKSSWPMFRANARHTGRIGGS